MKVLKRDGETIEDFNLEKIQNAISKARDAFLDYFPNKEEGNFDALSLAGDVKRAVFSLYGNLVRVEEIQAVVVSYLESISPEIARMFQDYRLERAKERVAQSQHVFSNPLAQLVYYDKYSRWSYDENRRETWEETVNRVVEYLKWLSSYQLSEEDYEEIRDAIFHQKVAPSMRAMNMAGEVAKKLPESIFNCAYLPIRDIDSFAELMWLSMAGAGVGYSVEWVNVSQLPKINQVDVSERNTFYFRIEDSAEGWVDALKFALTVWFAGHDVRFDYSLIREHGAPLRTKGGTASGYKVFQETLDAIRDIFHKRGDYLRPIDAHDICCHIANCVVQGNVRRSALISLFDYSDLDMLLAKTPNEMQGADGSYNRNLQRFRANNSVVLNDEVSLAEINDLLVMMDESGTSEPGIFSRYAVRNSIPDRRRKRNNENTEWGVNPCGEVFLRPYQVCNLSSAIIRSDDTIETAKEKVRIATIIGTIQSIATDGFNKKYLREEWRTNGKEERLLGVDLNGIHDNFALFTEDDGKNLHDLRWLAMETNEKYAEILGIEKSSAITTVKPSGNSSLLYDTSAGMHPRYAPFYIRRVRISSNTIIHQVLQESGYPLFPDTDQKHKAVEDVTTWVAEFPVKSPENAVKFSKHFTGLEFLEFWLNVKLMYTDHNPSVTISYKEGELDNMVLWIYENQARTSGLSFSKLDNTGYELAPYEEIDEETYLEMSSKLPEIDWSYIAMEKRDTTTISEGATACAGGLCLV